MNIHTTNSVRGFGVVILGMILAPFFAHAQSYVPVEDIKLNPAFETFSSNFDTFANDMNQALTDAPDSLRDIIAGGDPSGVAKDDCAQRDAEDKAFAYTDGPWEAAVASSSGALPNEVPAGGGYVQVNGSKSLRCLLEELNGYQKTSLYVQFHGLLKQYIADAQQKELSNQLLNQINAANLNWAKGGVQVNNGGILTSEPVYITNINNSIYSRNERTFNTVVNRAAAAPGDPIGAYDVCDPMGVATQVAKSQRALAEDRTSYVASEVRCSSDGPSGAFAARGDIADYMEDPNTNKAPGSLFMLGFSVNTPTAMPRTAIDVVQNEAAREVEQADKNYQATREGNSLQDTFQCSGDPDDPYCAPDRMISVTPKESNQQTVVGAVESGKEQIANSDTLDSGASSPAEDLSTEAVTTPDGVLGYDPNALANSKTAVNSLVQELYDSVKYAYFDLNGDQEDWAQAAILSIYDEMTFDQSNPNVVVPVSETPTEIPY